MLNITKLLPSLRSSLSVIPFWLMAHTAEAQQEKAYLFGFLTSNKEATPDEFEAGFSIYSSVWPLLDHHPGRSFQTGFFGTWMHPKNEKELSKKIKAELEGGVGYNTIEGGIGYWRSNHFPTTTPKFIMGGVARSFSAWANGPGSGKGRDKKWDEPKGQYGVAQLSPWVVFPLDGLNFKQGESDKSLGYGYLPLPLSEKKDTTYGKKVPQGNNSWTLFINSNNFKGPLAFFLPSYWARHTIDFPSTHGRHLDSKPSSPKRQVSMETQNISAILGRSQDGDQYARVTQMNFPINEKGQSILVANNTCYTKAALWDKVDRWFKGGEVASGKIDASESYTSKVKPKVGSSYRIKHNDTKTKLGWSAFAKTIKTDDYSAAYEWNLDWVTLDKENRLAKLPQYYKLTGNKKGRKMWVPVKKQNVPKSTKLTTLKPKDFFTKENDSSPITTPTNKTSVWKKPGPKAGPYKVKLGDGSELTYYWYKFCEQPAIEFSDYTEAEKLELQRRVELIHQHWSKDKEYLPAPTLNQSLVNLDPAILVKPPRGMEIGYVPIATKQE